jgi:hypothetical protein
MSPPGPHYDVFLSHDHDDAEAVEDLGRVLTEVFEFTVWLDSWILVPGESWQQAIAKGLNETATCAVCVGGRTARGWFRQEVERALERQASDQSYRVFPVLLPGASDEAPEELLPAFVGLRTWVDFRPGLRDPRALHLIKNGILGTSPGPWPPMSPMDTTLEGVKRDLWALEQIRCLLDPSVVIETQRRIVTRRFP